MAGLSAASAKSLTKEVLYMSKAKEIAFDTSSQSGASMESGQMTCRSGVGCFLAGTMVKTADGESHGGVSPHVHQPQRNVAPNGNIYGTVGTKTVNGGVTSPSKKDVKQLYEYLTNGKYQ